MRSFREELSTKLTEFSLNNALTYAGDMDSLLKLAKNSGHVQGLKAAADLFDEVRKSNNEGSKNG